MKIKEIDRTAHVAWSPAIQLSSGKSREFPVLLATGTAAQQLDASFSTSSSLEIYGLNLGEPGLDMVCKGSVAIDNRFHALCWGGTATNANADSGDMTTGTLVGGGDGGKLYVYNPNKIILGDSDALVFQSEKHSGPIRALDFNPFQSNLLASGSSESEIYIWDLLNMTSPMTPGAKSQPNDDVTSIAWNCQVQHILASTFATRCVVWDLRKNEPIIKVSSSTSRMSCKVVAWHPEVATQMCLASEDDSTPFIQLWDLRFAASPLKTMDNQQRGVLSLSWCSQDPDLLLSGGKDHRILCWNPNSNSPGGEIVCEIPTSNQWSFDIAWCPRNPGLFSSCSYDGHVSVFSLMGEQQQVRPSSKVAEAFLGVGTTNIQTPLEAQPYSSDPKVILKHPPKWLKRPVSVSFGFGGKLVTYEANSKQEGGVLNNKVYISQLITEPEISRQAKLLEEVLNQQNYSEYCAAKVGISKSLAESEIWSFIQAKFDTDPKSKFLNLLGHPSSRAVYSPVDSVETYHRTDSPEELFDHISQSASAANDEAFSIPNDDGLVSQVSRSLLGNNIEEGLDLCIKNDMLSEALLLGIAGGGSLLVRAQEAYLKKNNSNPLTKLISAILKRDWDRVADTCNLDSWKEALAGCLVYSDSPNTLCEKIGDRLNAKSSDENILSATLCYIITGKINKVVECWSKLTKDHSNPRALQELAEQIVLLKQVPGQVVSSEGENEQLVRGLCDYANYIASQGNLSTALMYAKSGNTNNERDILLLTHRLTRALGAADQLGPYLFGKAQVGQQNSIQQQPQPNYPVSAQNQRNRSDSSSSYTDNAPRSNLKVSNILTRSQLTGSIMQRYPTVPVASNTYNAGPKPSFYQPQVQSNYNPLPVNPVDPYGAPHQPTNFPPSHSPAVFAPYVPPAAPVPHFPPASHMPPSLSHNESFYHQTHQPTSTVPPPLHFRPGTDHVSQPQQIVEPSPPIYTSFADSQPGWNDPPSAVSSQTVHKQDYGSQLAPITHPLFQNEVQRVPELPLQNYHDGYQPPQSYNFQQQQYPHQQQVAPPQHQLPVVNKTPATTTVEPSKALTPIPPEHMILKDVLDELKTSCLANTNNMQIKRKLEDVSRKLEVLYSKLREHSLSASTLTSLNQLVQCINQRDYQTALAIHSHMVATIAFSEISGFMPGVKVLIQTAQQANIYLR